MERLIEKLETLGLKEHDLPQELSSEVEDYEELLSDYNERIDELTEQGKTQEEIDELMVSADENIDRVEQLLIQKVQKFYDETFNEEDEDDEVITQPVAAVAPQVASVATAPVAEVKKEKKSNDGWILFGAFALVVTLGAVNIFKK